MSADAESEQREDVPATGRWRGHNITRREVWVYADTGRPVADDPNRACRECGVPNTPEGHDPCLGTLPGVANACCGHGDPSAAYVQLSTGRRLDGLDACRWAAEHGCLRKKAAPTHACPFYLYGDHACGDPLCGDCYPQADQFEGRS